MKLLEDSIVFNDEHVAVLAKPPGVTGVQCAAYAEKQFGDSSFIFHSQGVPANLFDLAIVAKSAEVRDTLSALFRSSKVVRSTVAICHGKVDVEQVLQQAGNHLHRLECLQVCKSNNAEDFALSKVRATWCPSNGAALKGLLKKAGNPVVGKGANTKRLRPSGKQGSGPKGTFMACVSLRFPHPITGDEVRVEAEEPKKFEVLLDRESKHWEQTTRKRKSALLEAGIDAGEAKKVSLERGNVARVLGSAKFGELCLDVEDTVFIPRPASYSLVHTAVNILNDGARAPKGVLDLGTGSGALLLATIHECRKKGLDVSGRGVDILPRSVALAERNAKRCKLDDWVTFSRCDYSKETLPCLPSAPYSVVLANPPYLSSHDVNASNSLKDEPKVATDGGNDGLAMYKTIARVCLGVDLDKHCRLVVEVPGNDSLRVAAVKDIFRHSGYTFEHYGVRDGYDMIRSCVFRLNS